MRAILALLRQMARARKQHGSAIISTFSNITGKTMNRIINPMEKLIFASRWLQAPLYLGLIVAQGVYVYQFMHELALLITQIGNLTEAQVMLIVLGLIDVVIASKKSG